MTWLLLAYVAPDENGHAREVWRNEAPAIEDTLRAAAREYSMEKYLAGLLSPDWPTHWVLKLAQPSGTGAIYTSINPMIFDAFREVPDPGEGGRV